ncbi:MAG: beta-galactosidase, partial [Muribaculaceae bacterium]|nr:beta-galactosidase [Muribaculaceae bacterium]
ADRTSLSADGADVAVVNISLSDRKGNFAPTACVPVTVEVEGPARILGGGNGDPAWQAVERPVDPSSRTFTLPSFNGLAQVLIQTTDAPGNITLRISAAGDIRELSLQSR